MSQRPVTSDKLKNYLLVNPEDASLIFDIKRMEDIYDKMNGRPDDPHRHGYYTILWVRKANGKHIIDFHEFPLTGGQVYFVEPGQVHQVVEKERSYGYAMTFSIEFLIQNSINEDLIKDLFIRETYGYSPPLYPDEDQWNELEHLLHEMEQKLDNTFSYKYDAIGALLKLFLIYCNNSCTLNQGNHTQEIHSSIGLLRAFRSELEHHYRSWHKVSQYSSQLHITPDYLNTVLKSITGKGAKEHIQERIITEARRLFLFTDMSIKEVGYHLGFNEPAHFSSFFKKCMGQSPSSYLRS